MKNADMPAMPLVYAGLAPNGQKELHCTDTGLTKREMFAMNAMQGLLSANATYGGKTNDRGALSKDAMAFADALLAELDKEQ